VAAGDFFRRVRVAALDRRKELRVLAHRFLRALGDQHLAPAQQPHRVVHRREALLEIAVVRAAMHRLVELSIVAHQRVEIVSELRFALHQLRELEELDV